MTLTEREQQRYQRHLQLAGFGEAGQHALKQAHILIIGMGGLGCPAAQYLAAAGIGQLTLVDSDQVSLSNLQRQILFSERDIGRNKAEAAAAQLAKLNSDIDINPIAQTLTVERAPALIDAADIVLDCTDNFHTRYLINDLCVERGKPWVYASVLGFNGQLALFRTEHSCFRCLFPELAEVPDCNQAGVLGAIPGTLGTLQALEAIKYLAALSSEQNRLTTLASLDLQMRHFHLHRSPECGLCAGTESHRDHLADYQFKRAVPDEKTQLAADLFQHYITTHNPVLIDVRTPQEHAQDNLGGTNLPLQQWPDAILELVELHYQTPILLYCQTGVRSLRALQTLHDMGLANVKSLTGGLEGQR